MAEVEGLDVTVVVTSIPSRADKLARALASVAGQLRPANEIVVRIDHDREGAALNRHRALLRVGTPWTAFLDDDDEMMPIHLGVLLEVAQATGADLVYPWFEVVGGTDPFPELEGKPFQRGQQVPITHLVRTSAALAVGGFCDPYTHPEDDPGTDASGNRAGEDYRYITRLADAGYRIEHLHRRTWYWHHWTHHDGRPGNTSGLPRRV